MRLKRRRGGFTLAEIAVVIGIAGIVMSLTVAAGLYAKKTSDRKAALAAIETLETAVSRFEAKRGDLPRDLDGDGVTTTAEVVKQLKEWSLLGDDFSDLDPWGHPYVVVLRRDYLTNPRTMHDFNFYPLNDYPRGLQVYSLGPDGIGSYVDTAKEAQDDLSNFAVSSL